MKFKRAMLAEPHRFEVYEVDEEPGFGEVLIKIEGCGLCNWELGFWHGELNFEGYPHKLGHEFAGTVVKLGEGCTKLKVGDKVSAMDGMGGYGEYLVVHEYWCEKLADHIDPKIAFGEPQKCAITVLDATAPRPGDYGIILGCGPMGLWCIQALAGRYLGALIAIDIDDQKLELAKKYGATHVINNGKEDMDAVVADITGGHMADFVIEGTGIPALLNRAQDLCFNGPNARLVLMSSHHGVTPEFDFRKAVDRGLSILVPHPPYAKDPRDDFRRAVVLMNNHTFYNDDMVTHRFGLEDMNTAFEMLDKKPKDFVKGVFIP